MHSGLPATSAGSAEAGTLSAVQQHDHEQQQQDHEQQQQQQQQRYLLAASLPAMTQAGEEQPGGGGSAAAPALALPPSQQQQQQQAAAPPVVPLPLPLPVLQGQGAIEQGLLRQPEEAAAAALPPAAAGEAAPHRHSTTPPADDSGGAPQQHLVMATPIGVGQGSLAEAAGFPLSLAGAGALPMAMPLPMPLPVPGSPASSAAGESNATLYLGNLHPFVSEATLLELFAGLGGITELKLIKDKATGVSAGYGFAKFTDTGSAQAALDRVAHSVLFGQEARVNWAFQKEQKEEVGHHFHVFVGDLSSDVTDAMLHGAFLNCPGCSDARVMWDHATGRSRGYGFVSFRLREEADAAIQLMHGQFVGARRVRCGWAQHKTDAVPAPDPLTLDRADPSNTNVYVGNLAPSLSDVEVRRHFASFGPVAEVKLYRKGAYGFVRYKAHSDAVRAIVGMGGQALGGQVVKCSWGRHPSTPPSGVQTSLMLAAAAGISPLTLGSAAMLGHGIPGVAGFSTHSMAAGGGGGGAAVAALLGIGGGGSGGGGIGGGAMSVHSMGSMASMSMAEMHAMHAMMGMPTAATGAQALIHGGGGLASAGGGGGGLPTHAAVSASLGGGSQATMLQLDPAQLQQMYGLQYGSGGLQPSIAYYGAS